MLTFKNYLESNSDDLIFLFHLSTCNKNSNTQQPPKFHLKKGEIAKQKYVDYADLCSIFLMQKNKHQEKLVYHLPLLSVQCLHS